MTAIYKGEAYPGYHNPKAPVYVVNGAAGNREALEHHRLQPIPEWSVVEISQYGFQELLVFNSTTLQCNFYGDATGQELLDSFTITKSE